jgi:cell division protein FtsX
MSEDKYNTMLEIPLSVHYVAIPIFCVLVGLFYFFLKNNGFKTVNEYTNSIKQKLLIQTYLTPDGTIKNDESSNHIRELLSAF